MNIHDINIIRIGPTKRGIYEDKNTRYVAEYSCKINDSEIKQDMIAHVKKMKMEEQ